MRSLSRAIFLSVALVFASSVAWSAAAAPKQQTTESATQFYLRWRATASNAKSIGEITPFWTADTIEQFNMEPDSARAGTLDMIKRLYGTQTGVKVVKETATPNGATLSLEALDHDGKPIISSIGIVKENGALKIPNGVERWTPRGR